MFFLKKLIGLEMGPVNSNRFWYGFRGYNTFCDLKRIYFVQPLLSGEVPSPLEMQTLKGMKEWVSHLILKAGHGGSHGGLPNQSAFPKYKNFQNSRKIRQCGAPPPPLVVTSFLWKYFVKNFYRQNSCSFMKIFIC